MTAVSPDQLLSALNWRYAVKKFDPARTIPADTWHALEESLRLAPSSYGLQLWKFVVVTDRTVRERLVEHSWGQRQVADASHLVVFCVKRDIGPGDVQRLIDRTVEVRGTPPAVLDGYKRMMLDAVTKTSATELDAWARRQVYLAHGQFLTAAALLGVDTCPMEGFRADRYDELLDLPGQGCSAVVIAPAGYRAADDRNAGLAKVRFPAAEMVGHV